MRTIAFRKFRFSFLINTNNCIQIIYCSNFFFDRSNKQLNNVLEKKIKHDDMHTSIVIACSKGECLRLK